MVRQKLWQIPTLTKGQFEKFAILIYNVCGIRLSGAKKTMLTSRLVSRLRALGMVDFNEYYAHVTGVGGEAEVICMIDAVSTNKTDFFREDSHFSFLIDYIVPLFLKNPKGQSAPFRIWSAGCSSGEEPYTMAMVLAEYVKSHPRFDFSILGSDISTRILEAARAGIYKDTKVAHIPKELLHRYLLRGRGKNKGQHRLVPELQQKVVFQRINFTDAAFPLDSLFDVIFCRNVIIYFDRKTQRQLFRKLYAQLKTGGHIFLGHSEVMPEMDVGFEKVNPTVYLKR